MIVSYCTANTRIIINYAFNLWKVRTLRYWKCICFNDMVVTRFKKIKFFPVAYFHCYALIWKFSWNIQGVLSFLTCSVYITRNLVGLDCPRLYGAERIWRLLPETTSSGLSVRFTLHALWTVKTNKYKAVQSKYDVKMT